MFKLGLKRENFIYFHHLPNPVDGLNGRVVWLPSYPEQTTDTNRANYGGTTPLGLSAPRQSWSSSGPRQVNFSFSTHRDFWRMINPEMTEDIVDIFDKCIESIVLPRYQAALQMINPPIVTVAIARQLTITGVVNGSVTKTYSGAWRDGKQLQIAYSFMVTELEPMDAQYAATVGSYRGISTDLNRRIGMRG